MQPIAAGAVPALAATGLRKVYGGTVALADIDVEMWAGEIHGLLGENGAGKSTLVRLLAGIEAADSGTLSLFGEPLPTRFTPETVSALGVGFIHQNLGLIDGLSVAENVALAAGYARRGPLISWSRTRRQAGEALARMGVELDPDTLVANLPMALKSVTAIARALVNDVRLLILDEPTATLGAHEAETLFAILRRLRDSGVGIVVISHRLDEVLALTDRITVLRDGRVAGNVLTAEVGEAELVRMIIGADLPPRHADPVAVGEPVVVVDEAYAGVVGPMSFEARAGEVLGITGLRGAGHTAVPAMLVGLERIRRGTVTIDGKPFMPRSPRDAVARGCSLVPADRNGAGAVPTMSLRENLNLNPRQPWTRPLRRAAESRLALEQLRAFDVRPPIPQAEFSTLSGGNAQKVVLARCLLAHPEVLILEEPTAAVDIGARAEIHARIRSIAAAGRAVIVVSSDLEEIEQVCDRAIVMEHGQVRGILTSPHVTTSALLAAAYGVESSVN